MKKTLVIAILIAARLEAQEAGEAAPAPATDTAAPAPVVTDTAVIQPWELVGLDAEEAVRTKALREAARTALASVILNAPVTVKDAAAARGVPQTIVAAGKSSSGSSGTPADTALPETLRIVPVICSIGEQWVLAWDVTSRGILVASSRAVLPRPTRADLEKPDGWDPQLTERLTTLWNGLERAPATVPTALKIGLALGSNPLRHDEPNALCLNMLLSHELMKTHRTLSVIGADYDAHARDALDVAVGPERATRRLMLIWKARGLKSLPFALKADVRWGEAILASSIGSAFNLPFTISETLQVTVPPAVTTFLTQESQALTLADEPQISKINKAWVYVDRGRAWGLKMNDRLIIQDGDEVIKGHVVGFFGPGFNIPSPRGFPITEGAIVFIRKGQNKVKIGQTFTFDPTEFPAKWPPVKTPP